jgi:hypothetical protein
VDVERARQTIATEAPQRLRLAEMLRSLGARDTHLRDPRIADGSGAIHAVRPERLAVGVLVDKAAECGFGFLIGVLSLLAIPFAGLSTPFGLAIALLGAQLMIGRDRPWLIGPLRRRTIKMSMLDRVLHLLSHRARWIASSTRPRLELAIRPRLVGLAIVVLALALALPLPIPGSNLVFLIPLFVYAVGLLERDGLWIVVGHVLAAIDVALLIVFGRTVWLVINQLF